MEPTQAKPSALSSLKAKVEAKEQELRLAGHSNNGILSTAAESLANDPAGQKALEAINEVQARARIRSVTLKFLGQYFEGGIVSYYELYQAIDNETGWKRNADPGVNLNEFNDALLSHIEQYGDLSKANDPVTLDEYKAAVRTLHAGLQPFLELRAAADEIKLTHLLKAYEGAKRGK